jgi:hypothetical protein
LINQGWFWERVRLCQSYQWNIQIEPYFQKIYWPSDTESDHFEIKDKFI